MAKRTLAENPDDKARALAILFDTYCSPDGRPRCIEEQPPALPAHLHKADFEFAKRQGVMFDAVQLTRAQRRARIRKAASAVTASQIADAFVASLSTRVLPIRSALGSFAYARHFPEHECRDHHNSAKSCTVCGMEEHHPDWYEDLSLMNYLRHKVGGGWHTQPSFAALDLELLAREEPSHPTDADRDTLVNILNVVNALPPTARPCDIQKSLTRVLPSNNGERQMLVETLAVSGVFEPCGFPSYRRAFVDPFFAANSRTNIRTDWKYPIMHWRGSDGVNTSAVSEWFPWAKLRKGKWTL